MRRIVDIILSFVGLIFLLPILLFLWLIVWGDNRSPIFSQERVGRHQQPFLLFKFRTMQKGVPSVATHLIDTSIISPLGSILRRSKLDELPQLWNVLIGDMSLVGPRPCLFNQDKLISERALLGVFDVRPGITGLAQISGIDMSIPELLAKADAEMVSELNMFNYFKYIFLTVFRKKAR
jgi:lipopolysaccharide/colanic/teichoic acid biosynthesis glycosyltransferase